MSTRKRKQQGLAILVLALFVALVAGSAGFATGYGADAAKRSALSKQVEELKASASGAASSAETDALKQENEELKAKVTSLEEEVASLNDEKNALSEEKKSEPSGDVSDSVLDPVEKPTDGDNTKSGENETPVARVSIVDKITKYVILSIVVILVIMGISMLFFGKRRDDEEDDDGEEEPNEEPNEEKLSKASAELEKDAAFEKNAETDIFGDDGLKAEYERYEASHTENQQKEMTKEVPVVKSDENINEEPIMEKHESASVPDTLEELMAQSPSAHSGDE